MRFDNFSFLWEKFESEFQKMGINKEVARDFFGTNFLTLRFVESIDKDGEIVVHFIDETGSEYSAYDQAYEYEAYAKDGKVFILPYTDEKESHNDDYWESYAPNDFNISNFIGKAAVFDSEKIRMVSTTENDLKIVDYNYKGHEMVTTAYDSDARTFLRDKKISFREIENIEHRIAAQTLLPDAKVEIYYGKIDGSILQPCYLKKVTTAESELVYPESDYLVGLSPKTDAFKPKYTTLVRATKDTLSAHYNGKCKNKKLDY